jgi:hypothetical protein
MANYRYSTDREYKGSQHKRKVSLKYKSKAVPLNAMVEAWGKRKYSPYSFTTSALDGGEWSASRPGRNLLPGKGPPVPIVQ